MNATGAWIRPPFRSAGVSWIWAGLSPVTGAGPGAAMKLRIRLMMVRAELMLRRANRRRRQQLAAELATYTSHADLNDLYALLKTYPDEQTQEIRQILCRQEAYRLWTANRTR
jgi:hypothetical protein